RDEGLTGHHAFHDRVPAAFELECERTVHRGSNVAFSLGDVGESRPDVELRERSGAALHAADRGCDLAAYHIEERGLALRNSLFRAQDFGFVFFQIRCDISFCARQRLSSLVVSRDAISMGMRDLDVITEHSIEADLE